MTFRKVKKIVLMQPNFAVLGKRTWKMVPYNLAMLKACMDDKYETILYDPNFTNTPTEGIIEKLIEMKPDLVGITSFSTEYMEEVRYYTALVKKALPDSLTILGGVVPTVLIEKAVEDTNVDFFVMGEGEYRLPRLLDAINGNGSKFEDIRGIAYRSRDGIAINETPEYIEDLDALPFPDYGNLDIKEYGNHAFKYAHVLVPRQYPFAVTLTSRGCPYKCVFCAARTNSGTKVRMRSPQNVLRELDDLALNRGIREVIFLDDHFLFNKKRALDIMQGIADRNYGITWKCGNVAIFSLTREILELKQKSGCYQLTLSIESGVQETLNNIIKKPVNLSKAKEIVGMAKSMGFEIISNFIIGFPGETWDQIRRTIQYAEDLQIDLVNFHIATPLPKTRLMDMCIDSGLLKPEERLAGYTKAVIQTSEFSGVELQILRAFEWDRINFRTSARINKIAQMEGITAEEVSAWRKRTRQSLGSTVGWKE